MTGFSGFHLAMLVIPACCGTSSCTVRTGHASPSTRATRIAPSRLSSFLRDSGYAALFSCTLFAAVPFCSDLRRRTLVAWALAPDASLLDGANDYLSFCLCLPVFVFFQLIYSLRGLPSSTLSACYSLHRRTSYGACCGAGVKTFYLPGAGRELDKRMPSGGETYAVATWWRHAGICRVLERSGRGGYERLLRVPVLLWFFMRCCLRQEPYLRACLFLPLYILDYAAISECLRNVPSPLLWLRQAYAYLLQLPYLYTLAALWQAGMAGLPACLQLRGLPLNAAVDGIHCCTAAFTTGGRRRDAPHPAASPVAPFIPFAGAWRSRRPSAG